MKWEFDILYGEGVTRDGCVLDIAAELDIVQKSGSWYNYGDEKLFSKDLDKLFA